MLTLAPPTWQDIAKNSFTNWSELADYLLLTEHDRLKLDPRPNFPLLLPVRLAEKIEKQSIDDPLLIQFLPQREELEEVDGFCNNPVGDMAARREDRLLHKYSGRALLVCTSACAMHCRYCFRKHFDYASGPIDFAREIAAIEKDTSLTEIILSGGDPLSLSNLKLGALLDKLAAIPHVARIRFHTRYPIGIPERIDEEFLSLLPKEKQLIFVVHVNHPRELDEEVIAALKQLPGPVLNQAVLLRGVNDSVETLKELCEALVNNGILPYYLNQLDRVTGAAHFEVPTSEGLKLIEELRKVISGYAVPRYVQEIAGGEAKTEVELHPI